MRSLPFTPAFSAVCLMLATSAYAQEGLGLSGALLYQKLCLDCHGPHGEPVPGETEDPLVGDRPLADLTKVIHRTMPDHDPDLCVDEDAAKVAAYIHEAFYSEEAQARLKPAAIELSRLTVAQYETSMADLLGAFGGRLLDGEALAAMPRGLAASYYRERNFARDKNAFDRTDSAIDFHFGEGSPIADDDNAEDFAIRWEGALWVEETGDYEFLVETENGFRLWVNDTEGPLIDGWVTTSMEPTEHRATRRLLGGRAYPLRLHAFKYKDKSASMALKWRPPHKVAEIIPSAHLLAEDVPSSYIVATKFPADDGSLGYARGSSVSKAWDEAATFAAIDVANLIASKVDRFAGTKEDADDRAEKIKAFAGRFAERAFRRPLTAEDQTFYIDQQLAERPGDLEGALKRIVLLVLKSPRFLYPGLDRDGADAFEVASRLALTLWDSLPDAALWEAAKNGSLTKAPELEAQARRLLAHPVARNKVRGFFEHWLKLDEAEDLSKDSVAYPGFDEQILADLRTSLDLFIDGVVWSEASDYRELLLANYVYLNERLAHFYGLDASGRAGFHPVMFDPFERSGVITHPFLLSVFAYHKSSSPIHRGVFLTRNVMGRRLKPPPMAITFMDGKFNPHWTMREKVADLTKASTCQTCHSIINPLGFSLENYDGVGRFRLQDKEAPVNATSLYETLDGETILFQSARDVANHAVSSPTAREGFVEALFHHLIKQSTNAYGLNTSADLSRGFEANHFNIRQLILDIVLRAAAHGQEAQYGLNNTAQP